VCISGKAHFVLSRWLLWDCFLGCISCDVGLVWVSPQFCQACARLRSYILTSLRYMLCLKWVKFVIKRTQSTIRWD